MSSSSSLGNSSEEPIDNPEPAFHPLKGYALRIGRSDRTMLNYLAACVEAKPKDLLAHTRRILIAIDLKDTDEIFGALVDLFIAKGSSAFDLRANLLRRTEAFLPALHHQYLLERLPTGIIPEEPVIAPRSRLTKGIIGMSKSDGDTP